VRALAKNVKSLILKSLCLEHDGSTGPQLGTGIQGVSLWSLAIAMADNAKNTRTVHFGGSTGQDTEESVARAVSNSMPACQTECDDPHRVAKMSPELASCGRPSTYAAICDAVIGCSNMSRLSSRSDTLN